jgi:hypothetical protein
MHYQLKTEPAREAATAVAADDSRDKTSRFLSRRIAALKSAHTRRARSLAGLAQDALEALNRGDLELARQALESLVAEIPPGGVQGEVTVVLPGPKSTRKR